MQGNRIGSRDSRFPGVKGLYTQITPRLDNFRIPYLETQFRRINILTAQLTRKYNCTVKGNAIFAVGLEV